MIDDSTVLFLKYGNNIKSSKQLIVKQSLDFVINLQYCVTVSSQKNKQPSTDKLFSHRAGSSERKLRMKGMHVANINLNPTARNVRYS